MRKVFKVIIVGNGGVGKTSLRKNYFGEGFSHNYIATLGADFAIKKLSNNIQKVIQIWDLAGQPSFNSVREAYYVGTGGVILVYDIKRPETFHSIPNWIEEVITHTHTDYPPPMALIANKIDLQEENDISIVKTQQGKEYAKELTEWAKMDVPFIETSAKTGFNVDHMFETLIKNIELMNRTT
ncbi:MAG: GTPase KRas precursor [Candidatus Heimdallarchaeota archaeon LC_2]|nr:MAG: GTPase KRas precursor [Candidatus Heimdallarchaeota archaeon LC_2]